MTNKVWVYENKTTGTVIDCNDLNFLLHDLQIRGVMLPTDIRVDLILRGVTTFNYTDEDGTLNDIVISEKTSGSINTATLHC